MMTGRLADSLSALREAARFADASRDPDPLPGPHTDEIDAHRIRQTLMPPGRRLRKGADA